MRGGPVGPPRVAYLARVLVLLDPSRRPVIGHRGARARVPENTLPSFAFAVAAGVDAIELDLHLSRDGVPVVMHDPTLERTTGASGLVADRTAAELAALDAGAMFTPDGGRTFPFRGLGIGVPTLEQVIAAHPTVPMIVEIKAPQAAQRVLGILERSSALERVLVGSFHDVALRPFAAAGIPVSAAPPTLARLYLPALLGSRPDSLPFQAMCIPRSYRGLPLPIRAFAAVMSRLGRPTHVWTVNDPRIARRLWERGVRGIISDDPATILDERRRAA
jgi:glycerophosphoryl diester phosphodiesterase